MRIDEEKIEKDQLSLNPDDEKDNSANVLVNVLTPNISQLIRMPNMSHNFKNYAGMK